MELSKYTIHLVWTVNELPNCTLEVLKKQLQLQVFFRVPCPCADMLDAANAPH